jgi:hypothetical protein
LNEDKTRGLLSLPLKHKNQFLKLNILMDISGMEGKLEWKLQKKNLREEMKK